MLAELAAAPEVEDHSGRDDRHHLVGAGFADLEADRGVEQPLHHAVDRRQPQRGPAGEHQRVHPVDQVARVEQVGLAGARPATAYVDARHRAARAAAARR